jgi:hypothetical protein
MSKCKTIPVGKRINLFTVIGDGGRQGYRVLWKLLCDCGQEVIKSPNKVPYSCGCVDARMVFSTEEKNQIRDLYESGFTTHDLSLRFGRSKGTINKAIRDAGGCLRTNPETSRKHSIRLEAFNSDTSERNYWLGFLAADGNVTKDRFTLALSTKDIIHLEKFRDFLGSSHPISTRFQSYPGRKETSISRISIVSKQMASDLKDFGIIENKSLTFAPVEEMRFDSDFWRGMVDGDGNIHIDKRGYLHLQLCGSLSCIEMFESWCKSLVNTRATIRQDKSIWNFRVGGNPAVSIASALYDDAPVYLDRKYQTYLRHRS